MNSGEVSGLDYRNIGSIVEMRADSARGNFEFLLRAIFQQISTIFQRDFQLFFSEFLGADVP